MDEMFNVFKSSFIGFGIKLVVIGGKEVVYFGVQSLRSYVLIMSGEIIIFVQGSNRLFLLFLFFFISYRVVVFGSSGKSFIYVFVSLVSEFLRMMMMMLDFVEYFLCYIVNFVFFRMDDYGLKEICLDYLYRGCQQVNCNKNYFYLFYWWQLFILFIWMDFQDMEYIEWVYCDF